MINKEIWSIEKDLICPPLPKQLWTTCSQLVLFPYSLLADLDSTKLFGFLKLYNRYSHLSFHFKAINAIIFFKRENASCFRMFVSIYSTSGAKRQRVRSEQKEHEKTSNRCEEKSWKLQQEIQGWRYPSYALHCKCNYFIFLKCI